MSTELLNVALGRVDELKAELESLRQENARLREALKLERDRWEYMSQNMDFVTDVMLEPWKESIADIDKALNPPKRS